jgi:hypothetical protein
MLLNPNKIEDSKRVLPGSVEAQDPFDHPIPGQALTDEPGKWPWDKPPQTTDADDAVEDVISSIVTNPEAIENFQKLMITGIPIESIVNTISFTGFTEGRWNPDVAELIKLPLSAFFVIMAKDNNIPAKMFNVDPEPNVMSDEQTINAMREGNPEAFAYLQQQVEKQDAPIEDSNFLEMGEDNYG